MAGVKGRHAWGRNGVVAYVCGDFGSKQVPGAPGADGPGAGFQLLRVGPDHIAEGALMGDLVDSVEDFNLIQGGDLWGEAPVHAQDAPIN